MDQRTEKFRICLWKTKRLLDDLPYDNEINHYVISDKKMNILMNRINKTLGVKPEGDNYG